VGAFAVAAISILLVMTGVVTGRADARAHPAAAAAGTTYGGLTSQGFPVIVDVSRNGRQVVRAVIAIRLSCTSGDTAIIPDRWTKLDVSKTGKFAIAFGPETVRNSDGTTTDFEGKMSGAFNRARTTISGKWQFKGTDHDTSGAVTDTCDSGSVSWKAKQ
jgi:hypothetical protein